MTATDAFIEALDVLSLRGNKLFGDPGSWGEAWMPPPPSVAAGALRSHLLVHRGVDLADFAKGAVSDPQVGSPDKPGPFTLAAFQLARRQADGRIEPLYPVPADLVVHEKEGERRVVSLQATRVDAALKGSAPLPRWPALAEGAERSKPVGGLWLTSGGLRAWLAGRAIEPNEHLVESSELWNLEARVGVGLDAHKRRADDGKLFSLQAIHLKPGVGFAVRVLGAEVPAGLLRFGGDGRGACLTAASVDWPEPDYEAISKARRARLLLTSPGIFERGWLPTGAGEADPTRGAPFALNGVSGWIVSAAVSRYEVVSGWDLAQWSPKPAVRAAPAGSVWWLELDADVSAEALRKLVALGLWTNAEYDTNPRRAEGFNRIILANWNQ
ncbi:type III-B CRISPR module-associated Cmr3 family protein [Hydrogenophilus thermoluteolus]|uniref:type III-B CRISPR module-associated Cmr3 family protein n=1 Tax=Hydrogenophilus thermoluteolus TaxID=297 RepID=UPI003F679564